MRCYILVWRVRVPVKIQESKISLCIRVTSTMRCLAGVAEYDWGGRVLLVFSLLSALSLNIMLSHLLIPLLSCTSLNIKKVINVGDNIKTLRLSRILNAAAVLSATSEGHVWESASWVANLTTEFFGMVGFTTHRAGPAASVIEPHIITCYLRVDPQISFIVSLIKMFFTGTSILTVIKIF